MISAQWHFGLLGQYYWLDAISQFHFKIPIKVQLGFIKVWMKRDDERRSKALKEKLNLISFNTSLENPLAAFPVRWYLIKEEVNKQSWEENEKLIKRMSVWLRHGPKPTGGEKSLTMGKSSLLSHKRVRLDDESKEFEEEVWINKETLTIIPH